jgi:hypothetical protein
MKKMIGVVALLGLVATGAFATSASAVGICGTLGSGLLIDFDQGFSYETAYNISTFISSNNSQMTCVGKVLLFCAPFADLQANLSDPLKEYTFIITGTSAGTVPSAFGTSGTKYDTDYSNASFQIWEGSPRNAPAPNAMPASPPNGTVPSTFTDGVKVLEGTYNDFHVQITKSSLGTYGSSVLGHYQFTGGTLFSRVGSGISVFDGLWCAAYDGIGSQSGRCSIPAGYTATPNAKWDSPSTTAAQSSTWGAIKQLYR